MKCVSRISCSFNSLTYALWSTPTMPRKATSPASFRTSPRQALSTTRSSSWPMPCQGPTQSSTALWRSVARIKSRNNLSISRQLSTLTFLDTIIEIYQCRRFDVLSNGLEILSKLQFFKMPHWSNCRWKKQKWIYQKARILKCQLYQFHGLDFRDGARPLVSQRSLRWRRLLAGSSSWWSKKPSGTRSTHSCHRSEQKIRKSFRRIYRSMLMTRSRSWWRSAIKRQLSFWKSSYRAWKQ